MVRRSDNGGKTDKIRSLHIFKLIYNLLEKQARIYSLGLYDLKRRGQVIPMQTFLT